LGFWAAGVQSVWDLRQWGALIPSEVNLATGKTLPSADDHGPIKNTDDLVVAHRLTSFPLIHLNLFHALVNIVALTPLMERFESEYGTLTTLALFFGRTNTYETPTN
jgi:membrane associated rhomboid family serine protease